jgi:hypothetical protein
MFQAVIFAWNAARVKGTARREQFSWMLETGADAQQELFKVLSMEQPLPAADPMMVRAVINRADEIRKRLYDGFINKAIIFR